MNFSQIIFLCFLLFIYCSSVEKRCESFNSCFEIADALLLSARAHEAYDFYKKAVDLKSKHDDWKLIEQAWNRLALIEFQRKEFATCIDSLQNAWHTRPSNTISLALKIIQFAREICDVLQNPTAADELYQVAVQKGFLSHAFQRPHAILEPNIETQPIWLKSKTNDDVNSVEEKNCDDDWISKNDFDDFVKRKEFAWIKELQNNFEAIRDEYLSLKEKSIRFGKAGERAGNEGDASLVLSTTSNNKRSPVWKEFMFYHRGERFDDNAQLAPLTASLLDAVDSVTSLYFGQAHFSVLPPHTQLKPHTGATNLRLTLHLPLIVRLLLFIHL